MASIEKRSENTYRITVSCGYDSNGKKLSKKKTVSIDPALTERQREKKLNELAVLFEREVQNGTHLDGEKITFKEFAEKWLIDYAEKQLAPATLFEYRNQLNNRIFPALGHIQLSKLQPHHLLEFYSNLSESGLRRDYKYTMTEFLIEKLRNEHRNVKIVSEGTVRKLINGKSTTFEIAEKMSRYFNISLEDAFIKVNSDKKLSGKTINNAHRLISTILTSAVQWQLIMTNPCERVKPPKIERKEAGHYNDSEVGKMFELLEGSPLKYQAAIYIAIFGGLRLGEVAALEWSDINFKQCTISINKALQYLSTVGSFEKSPKTPKSNRIIALPSIVFDKLEQHRKEQIESILIMGELWQDHNKIFTQIDGKPIFHDTLSKWFSKWLKANNLPKLKFHELRHTSASLLIAQGVDIATVSKRLGHSNISTTIGIYTHAIQRMDYDASDKLASLFTNSNKKSHTNV